MARIPLPERGQPLDVEYIYSIVEAVNALSVKVSDTTSKTTTVGSGDGSGSHTVRTGDAKIVAGFTTVVTGSVQSGSSKTFSYSLGGGFKYAPVVTATAVNRGVAGRDTDATVVIDSVTTQSVKGTVYFHSSGNFNMNVNIIAVGIPNN